MKKKKYKIKPTAKQLKVFKKYWGYLKKNEDTFYTQLNNLEKSLRAESGIKDLEFIKDEMCGGEWVGIGNVSRTMKLYQRGDLE